MRSKGVVGGKRRSGPGVFSVFWIWPFAFRNSSEARLSRQVRRRENLAFWRASSKQELRWAIWDGGWFQAGPWGDGPSGGWNILDLLPNISKENSQPECPLAPVHVYFHSLCLSEISTLLLCCYCKDGKNRTILMLCYLHFPTVKKQPIISW